MTKEEILNDLVTAFDITKEEYKVINDDLSKNYEDISIENMNIDYEMEKNNSSIRLFTGVPEIDNLTKGLKTGLHVIAGFRKCCKSTFSINLIYRALNEGMNVCLLSLEMSKIEVLNILLSLHSYELNSLKAITRDELLNLYELDRDRYNDYLYSFLSLKGSLTIVTEKEIENYRTNNITYCETTLNEVFTKVNQSCIQKTSNPIDVLVVDNLNCIKKWDTTGGSSAYTEASNYFRKVALNFGNKIQDEDSLESYGSQPVIVLLLTQINRSGGMEASYSGFYPESCIAESVAIERDASTVIPIYVNQKSIEADTAMVKLEASRYSPAMLTETDIPINLSYGKMGNPIDMVNVDPEKERIIRFKKDSRKVILETPDGYKIKAAIIENKKLPDGYKVIQECDAY